MGSILIKMEDICDDDLVFNPIETRQILQFFWPTHTHRLKSLEVSNDTRRFAQSALIAAIEGSYAMGFVASLWRSTVQPGNITNIARKLSRHAGKHWWQHTRAQDLEQVRIYDTIRIGIAHQLTARLRLLLEELATSRQPAYFYVTFDLRRSA